MNKFNFIGVPIIDWISNKWLIFIYVAKGPQIDKEMALHFALQPPLTQIMPSSPFDFLMKIQWDTIFIKQMGKNSNKVKCPESEGFGKNKSARGGESPQKEKKGLQQGDTDHKINPEESQLQNQAILSKMDSYQQRYPVISPYYLDSTLLASNKFTPNIRCKMAIWFFQESCNHCLPKQVCTKAINLLDLFLMRGGKITIDKLQELGIACLGLAWKIHENGVGIIPVDQRNFSKFRIVAFEREVLTVLKYQINCQTLTTVAMQFMRQWDSFCSTNSPSKSLPLFLENQKDDQCKNMAAIFRIDEIFCVLDLCLSSTFALNSVTGFLNARPQNLVWNVLYFFIKEYILSPHGFETTTVEELQFLVLRFSQFYEPVPEVNGDRRLEKCIQIVVDRLRKERNSNPAQESKLMWEYWFQYQMKEARDISLEDHIEKVKGRKIVRKARKPMNLFEIVLNCQMFKPYYGQIARNLLKDLRPYFE